MAFSLSALLCLDLDRSKTVIPGMERHLSLEHKWHQTVKEPLRLVTLFFSPANDQYMVLSYDVTSAMVVSQNNEMSRGHETFFLSKNVSLCSNKYKFAWLLATWLKTPYIASLVI